MINLPILMESQDDETEINFSWFFSVFSLTFDVFRDSL